MRNWKLQFFFSFFEEAKSTVVLPLFGGDGGKNELDDVKLEISFLAA